MAVKIFLIDAYEKYASSALSATSLGRNIISAAVPLSSTALQALHAFEVRVRSKVARNSVQRMIDADWAIYILHNAVKVLTL